MMVRVGCLLCIAVQLYGLLIALTIESRAGYMLRFQEKMARREVTGRRMDELSKVVQEMRRQMELYEQQMDGLSVYHRIPKFQRARYIAEVVDVDGDQNAFK